MIAPGMPPNEPQRLAALRSLELFGKPPQERFDRYTRLARRLFNTPIALISLVEADELWFLSHQGLPLERAPRANAFCAQVVASNQPLLVPSARQDARFKHNPSVVGANGLQFYAGCPLCIDHKTTLGTLCILDKRPRNFGVDHLKQLNKLAQLASHALSKHLPDTVDGLTHISNRQGFKTLAQFVIDTGLERGRSTTLLLFNLKNFRPLNDHFGRAEGDVALKAFARLLCQGFRESDLVARLGGDKFAVLLGESDDAGAAIALDRFKKNLGKYNRQALRGYDLRFEVARMGYNRDAFGSVNRLLTAADATLAEASRHSRR
ncbi:sensor domain-containing diguanylate cyclase [Simiduia sp. 21SJ11W-1]|uniref:sensor domain-containing diguanylate cyclase n=1 Tax=Simiduia sp. 21SJ11W-1 TaxID=2909669 RepID=UPI0020A166BC|nr:sensor domain-containing diguanylate cyclase [Simiduia sp. 21SJ11W-1]UTA47106.1 sensor domain-containing diguanylate cyclase [Simiduia sp. 21SJ11W-1]